MDGAIAQTTKRFSSVVGQPTNAARQTLLYPKIVPLHIVMSPSRC